MSEERVCRICGKPYPLTKEYFAPASKRKSGKPAFRTECIECKREAARQYRKDYYAKNKKKVLEQYNDYAAENPDKVKEYQANYRKNKKDEDGV